MKTPVRIRRAPALVGLLLAALGCTPAQDLPRPEAIVLISIDTLRADMLGLYGYETYPTSPFLDEFARGAVVFENAMAQAPRTLTSHMSLFTGLPPHVHRVEDDEPLRPEIPTLAERLSAAGYQTRAFADSGYLRTYWGFDRGFDAYDQGDGAGFASVLPRAEEWLYERKPGPFFLFLHSYDVHSQGPGPYYPCPEPFRGMFSDAISSELNLRTEDAFYEAFRARQDRLTEDDVRFIKATYAEGIRHVDTLLRSFFERLRELEWYDRALIVIWSDHGEGLYDHAEAGHGEVFDHTVRVPLIVRLPGGAHAGRRVRSVVQSLDLAPTLIELAGAEPLDGGEGSSLLPVLAAEDDHRVAFAARTKDAARRFSLRTQRFHYVWHESEGRRFLFDVEADPTQRNNLASTHPEEKRLHAQLERWVEVHDRARGRALAGGAPPADAETEAALRALGYVE